MMSEKLPHPQEPDPQDSAQQEPDARERGSQDETAEGGGEQWGIDPTVAAELNAAFKEAWADAESEESALRKRMQAKHAVKALTVDELFASSGSPDLVRALYAQMKLFPKGGFVSLQGIAALFKDEYKVDHKDVSYVRRWLKPHLDRLNVTLPPTNNDEEAVAAATAIVIREYHERQAEIKNLNRVQTYKLLSESSGLSMTRVRDIVRELRANDKATETAKIAELRSRRFTDNDIAKEIDRTSEYVGRRLGRLRRAGQPGSLRLKNQNRTPEELAEFMESVRQYRTNPETARWTDEQIARDMLEKAGKEATPEAVKKHKQLVSNAIHHILMEENTGSPPIQRRKRTPEEADEFRKHVQEYLTDPKTVDWTDEQIARDMLEKAGKEATPEAVKKYQQLVYIAHLHLEKQGYGVARPKRQRTREELEAFAERIIWYCTNPLTANYTNEQIARALMEESGQEVTPQGLRNLTQRVSIVAARLAKQGLIERGKRGRRRANADPPPGQLP